jgi:hypothetical protein
MKLNQFCTRSAIPPFLFFFSFVLLFLVSCSASVIESIYIFKLNAAVNTADVQADVSVNFGVWGWCIEDIHVNVKFVFTIVDGHT